MSGLTRDEVAAMIRTELEDYSQFLMKALEIDYDVRPLVNGFNPFGELSLVGIDSNEKDGGVLSKEIERTRNAICLLRAAVLAYRRRDFVAAEARRCLQAGYTFYWIEDPDLDPHPLRDSGTNTQGFMLASKDAIILAFRGTETKDHENQVRDLKTDAKFKFTPFDNHEGVAVHQGFLEALDSVWAEQIEPHLQQYPEAKIWCCGHSLGGGLATLAAARIALDMEGKRLGGLLTIGQPRVGNRQFAEKLRPILAPKSLRIVKQNDLVPRVPTWFNGYFHVDEKNFHYIAGNNTYMPQAGRFYRFKDRALGVLAFLIQRSSPVADHDRFNYLKSIQAYQERLVMNQATLKAQSTNKSQVVAAAP